LAERGARLAIRLLQDAAERGEIDPWDVDVIAVIDGFLDQLHQRIALPRIGAPGGSFEQDLADTSEAFLAASVLVSLKAELLEASTVVAHPPIEDFCDAEGDEANPAWLEQPGWDLPRRPERHLWRRPVAPPPLQRPVTLGELIRQLEEIAEQLDQDQGRQMQRHRPKRYSEREAIEQVAALAHREKLPETTAALGQFLRQWEPALDWTNFEQLVISWADAVTSGEVAQDLDSDRVGVFWALLFLCHQGSVELEQRGGLFGPLSIKRCAAADPGSAQPPAMDQLAA
jgi:segregation and condensation protein A